MTPCFNVISELGHPEQLPWSSTVTRPLLNDLNFISPPSLATAGLIFVSNTSFIFDTTSSSSSLLFLSFTKSSLIERTGDLFLDLKSFRNDIMVGFRELQEIFSFF